MASHIELGKLGEQAATDFLREKGFKIVARNWRFKHKEVDIIAYDGDYLVIVEVRTRTSSAFEHPRESVTPGKIRFLAQAAEGFVMQFKIDNHVRFDVVTCIPVNGLQWEMDHIKGAFTAQVE